MDVSKSVNFACIYGGITPQNTLQTQTIVSSPFTYVSPRWDFVSAAVYELPSIQRISLNDNSNLLLNDLHIKIGRMDILTFFPKYYQEIYYISNLKIWGYYRVYEHSYAERFFMDIYDAFLIYSSIDFESYWRNDTYSNVATTEEQIFKGKYKLNNTMDGSKPSLAEESISGNAFISSETYALKIESSSSTLTGY